MTRRSPPPYRGDMLTLKVGAWFEASASGWGIVAIPIVLLLLIAAVLGRVLLA